MHLIVSEGATVPPLVGLHNAFDVPFLASTAALSTLFLHFANHSTFWTLCYSCSGNLPQSFLLEPWEVVLVVWTFVYLHFYAKATTLEKPGKICAVPKCARWPAANETQMLSMWTLHCFFWWFEFRFCFADSREPPLSLPRYMSGDLGKTTRLLSCNDLARQ